jgi:anti-sigma factor RsiW
MKQPEFDDETLMAYADGELGDETTARLEAALETDEALAARLAVFLDSRATVASALKPLIHEPVPEALLTSVRRMAEKAGPVEDGLERKVIAFRHKQTAPSRPIHRPWLIPIAASLVAVIAGFGGFMLGREIGVTGAGTDAALAAALDRETSGNDVTLSGSNETLRVVASFRDEHGDLCREYERVRHGVSTVSIACREAGTWVTRLALSAPHAEGYTTASAQETIDAYLSSIHAGAPLTPEEERAALAALR